MELKVIIELDNGEKYAGVYDIPKITSRNQSKQELQKLIDDCLDDFEGCGELVIKVYGEVIYKNGKMKNSSILYNCGPLYQNLLNLYDCILQN